MQSSASTVISPQLLELNEDIIAAIVENLQLGRLDDCMKYYSVLQSNLVTLALELDNLPNGNTDPYEALQSFPDEIMRKDVLEDLQPHDSRTLPKPPLIPPCQRCFMQQRSAQQCRQVLNHVEPSCKFSHYERDEFLRAAQVLCARQRQHSLDAQEGRARRNYKRWSPNEVHNLLIAISICGVKNLQLLERFIENRSYSQIRGYIAKNIAPDYASPPIEQLLRSAPRGYQPSPSLAPYIAAAAAASSSSGGSGGLVPPLLAGGGPSLASGSGSRALPLKGQLPATEQQPVEHTSTTTATATTTTTNSSSSALLASLTKSSVAASRLAPRHGGQHNFSALFSIATGGSGTSSSQGEPNLSSADLQATDREIESRALQPPQPQNQPGFEPRIQDSSQDNRINQQHHQHHQKQYQQQHQDQNQQQEQQQQQQRQQQQYQQQHQHLQSNTAAAYHPLMPPHPSYIIYKPPEELQKQNKNSLHMGSGSQLGGVAVASAPPPFAKPGMIKHKKMKQQQQQQQQQQYNEPNMLHAVTPFSTQYSQSLQQSVQIRSSTSSLNPAVAVDVPVLSGVHVLTQPHSTGSAAGPQQQSQLLCGRGSSSARSGGGAMVSGGKKKGRVDGVKYALTVGRDGKVRALPIAELEAQQAAAAAEAKAAAATVATTHTEQLAAAEAVAAIMATSSSSKPTENAPSLVSSALAPVARNMKSGSKQKKKNAVKNAVAFVKQPDAAIADEASAHNAAPSIFASVVGASRPPAAVLPPGTTSCSGADLSSSEVISAGAGRSHSSPHIATPSNGGSEMLLEYSECSNPELFAFENENSISFM